MNRFTGEGITDFRSLSSELWDWFVAREGKAMPADIVAFICQRLLDRQPTEIQLKEALARMVEAAIESGRLIEH